MVVALSDVIISMSRTSRSLECSVTVTVDVGGRVLEKRFVTVNWLFLSHISTAQCIFCLLCLCQLLVSNLPLLKACDIGRLRPSRLVLT